MIKVYVVLEELDDPWYGPGNINGIFNTKKKAEAWIEKNKQGPYYYRICHVEEFEVL
jgi:hypothetical protein